MSPVTGAALRYLTINQSGDGSHKSSYCKCQEHRQIYMQHTKHITLCCVKCFSCVPLWSNESLRRVFFFLCARQCVFPVCVFFFSFPISQSLISSLAPLIGHCMFLNPPLMSGRSGWREKVDGEMEWVKLEQERERELISCETGLKFTRRESQFLRSCATSSKNYSTSIEKAVTCRGSRIFCLLLITKMAVFSGFSCQQLWEL